MIEVTTMKNHPDEIPIIVLDNDIEVYIDRDDLQRPFVQIRTSPDSDSWQELQVFLNDAEATQWR